MKRPRRMLAAVLAILFATGAGCRNSPGPREAARRQNETAQSVGAGSEAVLSFGRILTLRVVAVPADNVVMGSGGFFVALDSK